MLPSIRYAKRRRRKRVLVSEIPAAAPLPYSAVPEENHHINPECYRQPATRRHQEGGNYQQKQYAELVVNRVSKAVPMANVVNPATIILPLLNRRTATGASMQNNMLPIAPRRKHPQPRLK